MSPPPPPSPPRSSSVTFNQVARLFCNLFETGSASEWLLYISEWDAPGGGIPLSNIRVTTKVGIFIFQWDLTGIADQISSEFNPLDFTIFTLFCCRLQWAHYWATHLRSSSTEQLSCQTLPLRRSQYIYYCVNSTSQPSRSGYRVFNESFKHMSYTLSHIVHWPQGSAAFDDVCSELAMAILQFFQVRFKS